jgi:ankyrin repeat protein
MIRLPFEDFAKMNRPIVLQLLLNAGAELEKKDIKGMTPLAYALEFSQLDVAEYLLDHIPPANINCTDATNRSPLHRAVDTQDEDCMKFCIKKGARLDLQDYLGYTPLELAVINQNKPFCELLLEAGAEIGALDDRRCNAIHLAIRLSNWPILGLLLDNLESSTPTKAPRTRVSNTFPHQISLS